MGLRIDVPTMIRTSVGVRVNVSLSVSHSIERGVIQRVLKRDVRNRLQAKAMLPTDVTDEDYEDSIAQDVITFYFIGGTALTYTVGKNITAEEFERIAHQLQSLEYRTNDDRVTSDDKTSKQA